MSFNSPTLPPAPAGSAGHAPDDGIGPRQDRIEWQRVKAILVGSIGNLVEWYDFYAYSAFSLYFSGQFFPSSDDTAKALASAGIFALGFYVRPLGGVLFGFLGDRFGRRLSLMSSVTLMCFGSLMIACCPTYGSVGVAAPALLLAARLLQGLSLGGEYGSSATYLSEMATSRHRGFYSSFQYVTLIGGQLVALMVLLVLQFLWLSKEELSAWGWRIPFLIGALLSLIALLMRRDLPETESFARARAQLQGKGAALTMLWAHRREALIVIGMTMGGTTAFYLYTTYMQKFLKLSVGLSDGATTAVSAASLIFAMMLQPIYGALSDRWGRRPLLIGFAVLGVLFTYPLMAAIHDARGPFTAFLLIAAGWMILSGYTSINAVVKAELFPAAIRATGVAVPYAIAVSLFGGSTEYIALWFKQQGNETGFYWYVTAVIAGSLVVYYFMRDTRRTSLIDRELSGGEPSTQ